MYYLNGHQLVVEEQRKDYIRGLEHDRLVRLAQAGQVKRPGLAIRAMAWMKEHAVYRHAEPRTSPAQPNLETAGTQLSSTPLLRHQA